MNGIGVLIGLVSGTVVGASAIGSGSLVIPLLLLFTPASAGTVVGTSVALATVTKLAGYLSHRRLGNVHLGLGRWLILGAVPGTAAAALLLSRVQDVVLVNGQARQLFGLLLIALALVLLAATARPFSLAAPQPPRQEPASPASSEPEPVGRDMRVFALLVGAAISFTVTLTSIGSGGLLMLALLLWRPAWLGQLVGTAIFYGLIATLFGTVAHLALGNIDPYLLAPLAAGSIPGVLFGSRLTRRIPEVYYQTGIAALNLALGLRLAWTA
jgi:uncharacterized membrane protein YfcA